MAQLHTFFPGGSIVSPPSLAAAPRVASGVASDVFDPSGTEVLSVGSSAGVVVASAAASSFANSVVGGVNRLTMTNDALAARARIGDIISISLDGTLHSVEVRDVNLVSGEVVFNESIPTLTDIGGATTIAVSTTEEAAVLTGDITGNAETVTRIPATEVSMIQVDGDGVDMKIVSISHDDYEDLTSYEANTLYLTTE